MAEKRRDRRRRERGGERKRIKAGVRKRFLFGGGVWCGSVDAGWSSKEFLGGLKFEFETEFEK